MSNNKAGIFFGFFLALVHAVWSLMVLMGQAQRFMDWIFGLHFIYPFYQIGDFNWATASMLIIVTFIFGYVFGWVFSALHKAFCRN